MTWLHFGIDTSNYTTSAAGITPDGEVFCAKRPLAVDAGNRGMRQSDALFCHTRDLPEVVGDCLFQARAALGEVKIASVSVSSTPRRVEGSYMPCFLAGVNAAKSAAALLNVPLFLFSHQEGHIEAVRVGAEKKLTESDFYAFHLSGGTTELLWASEDAFRYRAELLADTLDLTCGQLIDRCGVSLGLPFPAGAHLEKLALLSEKRYRVKIPVKERGINLSGIENRFERMKEQGEKREDLARFVFDAVIAAVEALLSFCPAEKSVLFSGGVSSSHLLREHFSHPRFVFAPPAYCADNAVGIAALGRKGVRFGS